MKPGPKRERELVNASRHLTSHLSPLDPPHCAVCYLKSNYILAKVENTKFMLTNLLKIKFSKRSKVIEKTFFRG